MKRTLPEVKCLHPTSSRREMCMSSVSNVIYHKFSHGAAFYTLNGKNVNVMHTCQVLGKSKSEIACAPLIFAYNLVIECAEKSGAQV